MTGERWLHAALALLLLAGCGGGDDSAADGPCNGALELCDRRFDEVAYPTTHNAMAAREEGFVNEASNQLHGMGRQLEDGVRAMLIDVHPYRGTVYLCHGLCAAGSIRLVDGLATLSGFLDRHPREVLTLLFEVDAVPAADVAAAFEQSGLLGHVYTHPMGAAFPTLRQMIARDERVLVMTDDEAREPAWYHYAYDLSWDNPYHAETPAELSCDENRGSHDNPLFLVNHFLTAPFASPDLAETVNHDPVLIDHARACQTHWSRLPNYLAVDFYEIGDLFEAVRALNGL